MSDPLDQLCINTVRFLSVNAVQRANSGHPGMPLGAAALAYVLWTRLTKQNLGWPTEPPFLIPEAALAYFREALACGSADLDPSTKTALKDLGDFNPPAGANNDTQGSDGDGWSHAGRNLRSGWPRCVRPRT